MYSLHAHTATAHRIGAPDYILILILLSAHRVGAPDRSEQTSAAHDPLVNNPFHGKPSLVPPLPQSVLPLPSSAQDTSVTMPTQPTQVEDGSAGLLTRFNSLRSRLLFWLFVPFVVATLVVILYSSVAASGQVNGWTTPVKDTMVVEELRTLDQRAYEQVALGYTCAARSVHL